jgi:hypothetical protein
MKFSTLAVFTFAGMVVAEGMDELMTLKTAQRNAQRTRVSLARAAGTSATSSSAGTEKQENIPAITSIFWTFSAMSKWAVKPVREMTSGVCLETLC